jgi:uncharacterized membrane protein (UPF0136 family)
MTDKNYNKRGRLIKSIRAILFILLLIFCGLMIYYELNSLTSCIANWADGRVSNVLAILSIAKSLYLALKNGKNKSKIQR